MEDRSTSKRLLKPTPGKMHIGLGIIFLLMTVEFGYFWQPDRNRTIQFIVVAICALAGILNLWRARRPIS